MPLRCTVTLLLGLGVTGSQHAQDAPVTVHLVATIPVFALDSSTLVWLTVELVNRTDSTITVGTILDWPSPLILLNADGPTPPRVVGTDYADWVPSRQMIRQHLQHLAPGARWQGRVSIGGGARATRGFVFTKPGRYAVSGMFTVYSATHSAWHVYSDTTEVIVR